MAFGEVQLVPGVNVERTPTLNRAGISIANLIRWRDHLVEKIGGWVRYYPFTIGSIPRDLHPWQDLNAIGHLGIGATAGLFQLSQGILQDITPQQTTTNTAPDFSTVINTSIVTIIDTNISNPTTNNSVFIGVPVSVGGLIIFGLYPIVAVISATKYQIDAGSNATATVNNGGSVPAFTTTSGNSAVNVLLNNHGESAFEEVNFLVSTAVGGTAVFGNYLVQAVVDANNYTISVTPSAASNDTQSENGGLVRFIYYIAIGPQGLSQPYGAGNYGAGAYGIGTAAPAGRGTPITATDWTQDNWGEILLSCPQGGGIYMWEPNSGFTTSKLVGTAPIINGGIFIANPFQILVAWASSKTGFPNPLQVSWCAQGDFTNWVPLTTDQAGNYQIPSGSKIVGGLSAPQQQLIWTDLDLWSMIYIGFPLVFSFNKLMSGCGLIGSHAAGILGNVVYWMGQQQFFKLPAGGAAKSVPCSVWDIIFQDLDQANAYKIRCRPNSSFNTIAWEFPSLSGGTGENDSYVEFNAEEGEWTSGKFPTTGRSAWCDQSVLGPPIGGTPNQLIYQHEIGYDGDGAAINPIFTTGYFAIETGEEFCFIDQLIPDFKWGLQNGSQNANLLVTVNVVNYPGETPRMYGPYSVNQAKTFVSTRARGRMASLTVQSLDSGSFWRLGLIRYRFAKDGRR